MCVAVEGKRARIVLTVEARTVHGILARSVWRAKDRVQAGAGVCSHCGDKEPLSRSRAISTAHCPSLVAYNGDPVQLGPLPTIRAILYVGACTQEYERANEPSKQANRHADVPSLRRTRDQSLRSLYNAPGTTSSKVFRQCPVAGLEVT